MASLSDLLRLLTHRAGVSGIIETVADVLFAPGKVTIDRTCAADTRRALRVREGSTGVADTAEICLKDSSDAYAWTQTASGGTVGLAAHIADTSTHGTTGNIVGTTDTQTLTNKTLTTPTIADLSNMTHPHTSAAGGGSLGAAAIGSGTIATARLGSGAADSSVFLRGDQTWSALPIAPGAWPAPFVDEFGTNGTGNGEFDVIRGIAVDASGNVYVSSDDRIQKFTTNGTYTSTLATAGTGNGQVDSPSGLKIHPVTGNLWIADTGNLRIQEITTAGAYVSTSAVGAGTAVLDMSFRLPVLAADDPTTSSPNGYQEWDAQRRLWQTDPNGVIDNEEPVQVIFDPGSGAAFLFALPVRGDGLGEFDTPNGIDIDPQGNVYVADTGNDRVQVFDNNGIFQGYFGSTGTGDGEFDGPIAIAISDNYIYVADNGNSRVQIFANPTAIRRDSMYIHFIMYDGTTSNVWTNMPAAATELLANAFFRKIADLTGKSEFRIVADIFTAGATGADLHLEYTTDTTGASGWTDAGTQATQEIDIGGTGYRYGTWTTLAATARQSVLLRFVGTSGNATADPFVTNLNVEFR